MSVEKHAIDMLEEGTGENHRKMVEKAAEIFLSYDLDAMAEKLGIECDEDYLYTELLKRSYRISRQDGSIEWSEDGFEHCNAAGFSESMILYDLIAYSRPGAAASGEYTQVKNLADTVTGQHYAGKGMIDSAAEYFDGREQELINGCESLGGVPYGRGDVSFRVPVWRNLCFVLSFWSSDDEFPPQLVAMVDMNMKDFIHYETIWYLEGYLIDRVKKSN